MAEQNEYYRKRNWKIYFSWIEGKEYGDLAKEFELSPSTVKEICTSLVPESVKQKPWQTANSYRKFREWKRKQKQDNNRIGG